MSKYITYVESKDILHTSKTFVSLKEFVMFTDSGDYDDSGSSGSGSVSSWEDILDRAMIGDDYIPAEYNLDIRYYIKSEVDSMLLEKLDVSAISSWAKESVKPIYTWSEIVSRPTALSEFTKDIDFDEYYFTESEVTVLLAQKLSLSGGTLTGGGVIQSNGSIVLQQSPDSDTTGLSWYKLDDSDLIAGIGVYTVGSTLMGMYIGWGASPWLLSTNLYINENNFTYKSYDIWHAGNSNLTSVDWSVNNLFAAGVVVMFSTSEDVGDYTTSSSGGVSDWSDIQNKPTFSGVSILSNYDFDSRYYTETEVDAKFALKLDLSDYTASDILTKLKTVDGSGSGLDADTLDGVENRYLTASLFRSTGSTDTNTYDADEHIAGGMMSNYGSVDYWQNAPSDMYYGSILHLQADLVSYSLTSNGTALSAQLAWDVTHNSTSSTRNVYFRAANNLGFQDDWKQIAFTTSNVASATKLYTSRSIWGQSFDGTADVSGALTNVTTLTASDNIVTAGTLIMFSTEE
ncbi:MAG: hypothetical protein R3Y04_08900 [Rikenellaceae bacterium]